MSIEMIFLKIRMTDLAEFATHMLVSKVPVIKKTGFQLSGSNRE